MTFLSTATVLLGVFLIYGPTTRSMMAVWASSETFTHGFLVVPISLWLIWRQRHVLAATPARPFLPALLLTGAGGASWLLGDLSASLSVSHFSLVVLSVSAVVAVFGIEWARQLMFPLAFLFFAVPFGEVFVPVLMDWTADFTVSALRVSGVPVFREGNDFTVPSGRWSVIEACSGTRYLIVSVMVGTLYAWLMYRTPLRRALFIAMAVLVPIVANWLRAYLIVMLGYVSNNRLYAVIDHRDLGWLFFGMILFALFALGAIWREDDRDARRRADSAPDLGAHAAPSLLVSAVAAALGLAAVWPMASAKMLGSNDRRTVVPASIAAAAEWAPIENVADGWKPHLEQPRALSEQRFRKATRSVTVHIGFFRNQAQGGELVNSLHRLTLDHGGHWRQVSRAVAAVSLPDQTINLRSAVLRNTSTGGYVRVWHGYWLDRQWTASDVRAKVDLAIDRLLFRSDTSAWVALETDHDPDQPQVSEAVLRSFVVDMLGSLENALGETAHR
jgi:exosortase A